MTVLSPYKLHTLQAYGLFADRRANRSASGDGGHTERPTMYECAPSPNPGLSTQFQRFRVCLIPDICALIVLDSLRMELLSNLFPSFLGPHNYRQC